jgi:hypothetical protein
VSFQIDGVDGGTKLNFGAVSFLESPALSILGDIRNSTNPEELIFTWVLRDMQ